MVSGLFKDTVTLSRQSRLEVEPGSVTLMHFRTARMLRVVLSWLFQFLPQLQVFTRQQHLPRVPCCPLETSGGHGARHMLRLLVVVSVGLQALQLVGA